MAWPLIAAAALSAGSQIAGGIMGKQGEEAAIEAAAEDQQQLLEEQATTREKYSQMAQADAQAARDQLNAAEQTKLNLTSLLGQPGTYGAIPSLGVLRPSGATGLMNQPGVQATSAGSPLAAQTKYVSGEPYGSDWSLNRRAEFTGSRPWERSYNVMDPNAMTAQIASTPQFRAVSQMVAEAEQITNRSGPAWEELNQTMLGSIYEGAAQSKREAAETISRELAKKGNAGRSAWAFAQEQMAQERINRDRTSQLWQARAQLEKFRTTYPASVISYANAWVNNLAGLRDAYTANLIALQLHWSETLAPVLISASSQLASASLANSSSTVEGLVSAAKTQNQAVSGALEGMTGAVTQAVGEYYQNYQQNKQVNQDVNDFMKNNPDLY